MKKVFKRYLPYILEYKLQYFLVGVGIVLNVVATAGTAYIMKPMMDQMFVNKDESMLYIIPISLILLYFFKSVGRYVQSVFMAYIGTHIVTRFREILLEKIIFLDMEFLYLNRSGELISRITADVARVQYFVSNLFPELIRELLSVIALIGYVIYLNYELAFYALVVIPVVIYPLFVVAKRLKKYSHRSQEMSADLFSRLGEIFNNVEIVKISSTEDMEIKKFDEENWKFFKVNMKAVYVGEIVSPFLEISGALGLSAIIYIGGKEVYDGSMSVGDFMAFLTAVGLVFKPIKLLGQIYSKIQDALAASDRIFEIIDRESSIVDGVEELDSDIDSIEYSDVVLSYNQNNILNHIDLKIQKGKHIALVGDSGGGKSTFVQMLLRYYDPDSGVIKINSKDIKNYTLESLKSQISLVTQNIYIFNDTIKANVAYGYEDIDENRVIDALKRANAYEFVMQLENGLDTIMNESGSNLSGGQRQRIAIARAIYKNSSLLLLDEATSALDNESEAKIQKALEEFCKDKITITIAHRLSTIEHADEILFLRKGKIIASGTYEELLKNSSEFRKLSGKFE